MASYVYDSTDSYPFSSVDNGFVYAQETSTEDFGAVNVASTSQESYDFITVTSNNSIPFGFSTVSGSANTYKPKKYSYSSDTDNLFVSENNGLITSSSTSSEDYGTITVSDNVITREDRYLIIVNQSILAMEPGYSFSTASALDVFVSSLDGSGSISLGTQDSFAISKVSIAWAGTGTPFEIGGSANEIVKAFSTVGTSGPLRLDITSTEVFVKLYSLDVVVPFNELDYGSIPSSPTIDVDFGLVSQENFGGEKDYGLIVNTQEITPYGLYESSGAISESITKGAYIGSGGISTSGEVVIPLNVSIESKNGLITISGTSSERNTESYSASGSLFNTSGSAEKVTFNPPEDTTGLFDLVGGAAEKNTESYIGNAIITKTLTPDSVEINTSSFVNVILANSGTGIGSSGGFNVGRQIKFGTTGTTGARRFDLLPIDVSAYSTISFTGIKGNSSNGGEEPDPGENLELFYSVNGGSSFTFIADIISENDTTFNSLNVVDITLPNAAKTSSTIFRILQPSSTGVTFDHYAITQIQLSSQISGNIIFSGGYTDLKFISDGGETTQLFSLSGAAVERNTEEYHGSGVFSVSGIGTEKNTEVYVSELAQPGDLFADYGDLSAVTESEDYGLITNAATNVDYRYLYSDFFEIDGHAIHKFSSQVDESTQLFVLSGFAEEKFTSQGGESTQVFTFTGNGIEKNTEVYIGEGTFSSFSGAAESVTYRYSFDSFIPFFEFDYGSISQAPTNEINLGNVSAPNTGGEQDYGNIIYNNSVFPYGLWQTSGAAIDSFTKNIHDAGGFIVITGAVVLPLAVSIKGEGAFSIDVSSIEKNTESYVASGSLFTASGAAEVFGANPPVSTHAFTASGTAIEKFRANPPEDFAQYTFSGAAVEKFRADPLEDVSLFTYSGAAVERNTESYDGLGTIIASGTNVEKNTESYFAPLPAFIFANVDNGQIDDPAVNEDYGLITQASTEFDNLQGIVLDYFKVSGFANESFISQPPEDTSLFTISVDHIEKFTANPPETTVTFSYAGSAVERNTEEFHGNGTATFDIFSEVRKTLPSYVGFGFAFTANGSAEAVGVNPPENTQLFEISGSASYKTNPKVKGEGTISIDITSTEKNTEVYIGTGSLFSIVDGSESRTYVYDEFSSVLFLELDYGSLTQPVDTINDFGQITNFFNEVDYGTVGFTESVFPFGSAFISGSATEIFAPNPQEETQLFIFYGSAVEKFTAQVDETTQIFNISGIADESFTEFYIGAGVTTFSGTKVEKNTEAYAGSGSVTLTGTKVEKNTESYVGDNPIYTLSGTAVEKFTSGGGETTQLFTLSGSAVERNTESYVGTGNLFSIVDGSEARTYIYVAQSPDTPATIITETYDDITQTANAYENYGFITDAVTTSEDYGITDAVEFFVLKGAADESFNKGLYTASGFITIGGEGKLREIPRWVSKDGVITISGNGTVPLSIAITGTGSVFAINGSAERVRFNPPAGEIGLFNITGSAANNNTEVYIGTGLSSIDVTHNVRFIPNWNGSGTISIEVTSVERNTESHFGSGSIFVASGSAIAFGANPPEDSTTAFDVTGTAVEKFRANPPEDFAQYTFSNSASERFSAQTPETSVTLSIAGAVVERNTESYVGTGTAFTFVDSDERVTFDYTSEIPEILNEYRNLIKDATTSTEDYGLISVVADSFDDWGATVRSYIEIIPTSIVRSTPREFGTGSLFTTSGAAEVFGANPPENTQIFSYSGSATEKNTESYIGLGQVIDLTGNADEDLVKSYVGSGSLGNLGGSIFFIGYYPYTDYVTFYTSGAASYAEVNKFGGTGSTSISGSGIDKNTEVYIGSGSLFGVGGGAEARVYVYGSNVIIGFNEVDYGFISETPTVDIDYNNILSSETGGIIDYGQIRFEEAIIAATGLIEITGAVYVTTSPAYYGSGTLTASDTALEKNTEAYNGTGSTSLTGVGLENNTEVYIGTGNVSTFSGAAEVFGANPSEDFALYTFVGAAVEKNTESYVGVGTETLSGAAVEKNTEAFNGSGNLFTASGAAEAFIVDVPPSTQIFNIAGYSVEKFTANPPKDFAQFSINVTSVEKNTEDYVGTGSVSIDITSVEKNTEAYIGTGTSTISGVGVEKNTEVYIGTGSLFTVGGAAERVRFNPPEDETGLFDVTGTATEKNTESYVGTGSTTLTGAGVEKNTEAFVGTGSTALTGAGVEKNTEVYIGTGSTSLSGVAETREIAVYTAAIVAGEGKYIVSVSSTEKNTESYVGIGTATASGVATEKNTETFNGTGEFFTFLGAAESRTINPEEDTVLYTFVGAAVERNTEKWVGTGTTTLSGTKVEKNTESYVGTGTTTASGVGVEKNTEVYIGTGNLFTTSGAAEAFGVNPPENTHLFVYSGAAVERNTESYVGTGTETLTGTAVEKNTESYVGTGVLNALSGAAEAYSAQTPENTVLFIFTGICGERFIANAPENTHIFTLTGTAGERNTEAHFGTGTATLTGTAVEKNTEAYNGTGTLTASGIGLESFSPVYVGTGELFNYNGSAESFGANPPEDISLFTIAGSAIERNTEAHFVTGGATLSGVAIEKNTEVYEGTGTATLTGISFNSKTIILSGSGSIFTIGGSAESFGVNPPENTHLFFITGSAVERNTEAHQGTGTLNLSGEALAPILCDYVGSGFISTFDGSAESFSANPPENTQLFTITGFSTERNTEVYYGEEVINTSGQGQTPRTRIFAATGSLFTFSGASESVGVNPPESTVLFSYAGSAVERNTEAFEGFTEIYIAGTALETNTEVHNGSGATDLTGIGETPRTRVYDGQTDISLSGSGREEYVPSSYNGRGTARIDIFSEEKITNSYNADGTLFTIGGASESIAFAVDNIILVSFAGFANTPRVKVVEGSGSLFAVNGSAESFGAQPPEDTVLFTYTGSATERNTESYIGTGSLFSVGGGSIVTTRSVDNTVLFNINGSSDNYRIKSYDGNGTLFTINGSSESVTINPSDNTVIFNLSGSSTTANNPYRPPRTYVSII